MKKLAALLGIAFILTASTYPAFAFGKGMWGGGHHMMGGGPCSNMQGIDLNTTLTEEQKESLARLKKEFYDATADMRNEVANKKVDLRTLMRAPAPDKERVMALQKEIHRIKGKIAEKRMEYILETRKVAPESNLQAGMGCGMGGRGMGHGFGGGGFGQGNCNY